MPVAKCDLRLDWATHKAASYACRNWHYSKSIPVPPLLKVGVWENGVYIGVVIFSRGANKSLLAPYGLKQIEGCELTRIALTAHNSPVSRIIKLSLSFLRKKSPQLRLIISFADPHQGHHGGIYQATNWLYTGKTSPSKKYTKSGKVLHPRQISPTGKKIQMGVIRDCYKPSECKIEIVPGKHRYIMPLDKKMRVQILPMSKPYPKRVKKANSGDQPESGGAVPTHTLHLSGASNAPR